MSGNKEQHQIIHHQASIGQGPQEAPSSVIVNFTAPSSNFINHLHFSNPGNYTINLAFQPKVADNGMMQPPPASPSGMASRLPTPVPRHNVTPAPGQILDPVRPPSPNPVEIGAVYYSPSPENICRHVKEFYRNFRMEDD